MWYSLNLLCFLNPFDIILQAIPYLAPTQYKYFQKKNWYIGYTGYLKQLIIYSTYRKLSDLRLPLDPSKNSGVHLY